MPGRPTLRLLLLAALLLAALPPLALAPLGWQAQLLAALVLALVIGLALARHLTRPTLRLAEALRHLADGAFRSAVTPLPSCAPQEWETLQRGIADLARMTAQRLAERDARIEDLSHQLAQAIRNLEQANQALAAQRFHDDLTHLPNRRALWKRVAELERAHPDSYGPVQVVVFRLREWDALQHRHGPEAADALVAQVARRIEQACRAEDVLVRYGEDRFVLLLERCSGAVAQERAEAIRAAVGKTPLRLADEPVHVALEVGSAESDSRLSRPAFLRLLQAATAAMPGAADMA